MTSDRFYFAYELHQAGWATARIRHGDNSVDMPVSYLHDSLRELAIAVYWVAQGPTTERVVFMAEPGEHQLTLTRIDGADCCYFIELFNDWDRWGIRWLSASNPICNGVVPVRRLVQQVYSVLWALYAEFGETGYKARWGQHDFPLAEMQRLVGRAKRE